MITLYLIRHGQTIWNHSGRYQGITDVPLSELGKQQADRLVNYFEDIELDAIYSSDLSRAYDTAVPLAKNKNLTINSRSELREIDFGEWEGLTYEEIDSRWPGAIMQMYFDVTSLRISKGETFLDLMARSAKVIDEIEKEHSNESVAIVCHGGTIRCLLCTLLDLDLKYAWKFKQDNANVTIIHFYGKRNLLALLNDVHHLINM